MGYYSFVVEAPRGMVIHEPQLILEKGRNVFSTFVTDLTALRDALENEGVVIFQENQLDDHEPTPPVATFDDLKQLS